MFLRRAVVIISLWILIPAAVLGALALAFMHHDNGFRVDEPPEPYPGLGRPMPNSGDAR